MKRRGYTWCWWWYPCCFSAEESFIRRHHTLNWHVIFTATVGCLWFGSFPWFFLGWMKESLSVLVEIEMRAFRNVSSDGVDMLSMHSWHWKSSDFYIDVEHYNILSYFMLHFSPLLCVFYYRPHSAFRYFFRVQVVKLNLGYFWWWCFLHNSQVSPFLFNISICYLFISWRGVMVHTLTGFYNVAWRTKLIDDYWILFDNRTTITYFVCTFYSYIVRPLVSFGSLCRTSISSVNKIYYYLFLWK